MTNIIALATAILAAHPNPARITAPELAAFAAIESGGNPDAIGDNGLAWGLFQFHLARWKECGGSPLEYRRAPASRQVAVMVTALNRYALLSKRMGIERVRGMATFHNVGHAVNKETAYVEKIRIGIAAMEALAAKTQTLP